MTIIHLTGHVNESGELSAQLPIKLPPGQVSITIEIPDKDPTWTDQELEDLLRPIPAMTSREIVEAGLIGGWEDEDIVDGAMWVDEQRYKHRERHSW